MELTRAGNLIGQWVFATEVEMSCILIQGVQLERGHPFEDSLGLSELTVTQMSNRNKFPAGSPSSKYEHRRTSALLRNIRNIKICMGKKPIVSVTYENERISIKNSLPCLKCMLRLSCVVHGPIYGRFMGFYVNGFLSNLAQPW